VVSVFFSLSGVNGRQGPDLLINVRIFHSRRYSDVFDYTCFISCLCVA
jgi:hypothetical protein